MKILLLVALLTPSSLLAQQSGYSAGILEGISNRGENQGEPYVTAGDRAYVIGSQNGNFPDMGTHVPGEMGGVWVPAQTFNRKLPGSISEMMPDYGCLVQAWTMYGVVVPLVHHVFGIQPDAVNKTVVFEPHLPTGWEDLSIEDLPVGANLIAFARARTGKGVEYHIEGKEGGWRFVLKPERSPGAKYYLNGKPVTADSTGIRMSGRKNHVSVVPR